MPQEGEMSKPTPPTALRAPGKALWKAIVSKYDLRPDELRTLEDACATTDMLHDLEAAWREKGRPFMSTGSMGQEVEHPLIGSIDKMRKTRQAFFRQLKLPDGAAGSSGESNQQRAAAQSRWAAAHGSSA
jgi:hypothetical protein